jgi:serine/threonine-protein kinase
MHGEQEPAVTAATSEQDVAGRPLGSRYLLGEVLGRGATGRVYRGHIRNGGEVAIKLLREDIAEQPDLVRGLLQERQVLRSISHPNVVQVMDLVAEGDDLAIVMQLVPGGDLDHAVPGLCTAGEALRMMAQVADGLVAVHAAGVVHCDLKPANVLCQKEPDGRWRLRLTDFGISRLAAEGAPGRTGIVGTPGYLAPEVGFGAAPSPASDVYALGVMLYELCTGAAPFIGDAPLTLLLAHAHEEVPRPVGIPEPLWDLLRDLLDKNPANRPTAEQAGPRMRALAPTVDGKGPFPVLPPGSGGGDGGPEPPVPAAPHILTTRPSSRISSMPGTAPVPLPARPAMPLQMAAPTSDAAADARSDAAHHSFRPDGPVLGTHPEQFLDDVPDGRRRRRTIAGLALAGVILLTAAVVGVMALRAPDQSVTVVAGQDPAPTPTPSASGPSVDPSPAPLPSVGASTGGSGGVQGEGVGVARVQLPPDRPAVSVASAGVGRATVRVVGVHPNSGAVASVSVTHLGRRITLTRSAGYGITLDKLTAGRTYSFTGTVCNTAGLCASDTASYTPPKLPPGAPALAVAEAGEGRAAITVSKVAATTGTISSVSVTYGGRSVALPVGAGTAAGYRTSVGGLVAGQAYPFVAQVCNSFGLCTTSSVVTYTPPKLPPSTPTISAEAGGGTGQARITVGNVVANTGTIASVVVGYDGKRVTIPAGAGSTSTTTVSGLTAGKQYSFTATVCNSVQLCATSGTATYTPPVTPPKPGTVTLSRILLQITVRWTATTTAPAGTRCTVVVNSTPAGSGLASRSVGLTSGSATVAGKAATSYQAVKTCTYTGGEVTVRSATLAIP